MFDEEYQYTHSRDGVAALDSANVALRSRRSGRSRDCNGGCSSRGLAVADSSASRDGRVSGNGGNGRSGDGVALRGRAPTPVDFTLRVGCSNCEESEGEDHESRCARHVSC